MADLGRRGGRAPVPGNGERTEAVMARKDAPKPRHILTEGAIFHKDKMHESVTLSPEGDHHIATVGDVVMLTDDEFDLHREHGVCLVDAEKVREAAE